MATVQLSKHILKNQITLKPTEHIINVWRNNTHYLVTAHVNYYTDSVVTRMCSKYWILIMNVWYVNTHGSMPIVLNTQKAQKYDT